MASILYEAETQRQHPRYRLPMHASIADRPFDVLDWSLGGFALPATENFKVDDVVRATLSVPFDGYGFATTVTARVCYVSVDKGRTGFAFVDLEERQACLLRFIADAFLSGEVVQAGDVLDVAKRSGGGRSRAMPEAPSLGFAAKAGALGRRLASTTAVLAIIGALGAFLWANVYDELYVVRAETAIVDAKVVNLASPAVGRIGYLNEAETVSLGEPLMTVNPPVGEPIIVQSPCDCLQVERRFSDGDFVKTGDTVVRLMREDATIVVSALVPSEKLMSVYGNSRAQIVYADGRRVDDAVILWRPGQNAASADIPREPLTVVLDPMRPLSPAMMGQPVEVTFDLFDRSALGRVFSSMNRSVSLAAAAFTRGGVDVASRKEDRP